MRARAHDLLAMKYLHVRLGPDATKLPQPMKQWRYKRAVKGEQKEIVYLQELNLLVFTQKKFRSLTPVR